VAESVSTYGKHLRFQSAVIFGGVNINPHDRQAAPAAWTS